MQKFVSDDIVRDLRRVLDINTTTYKKDFDIDVEIFQEAFESPHKDDRDLIWFSRDHGTACFSERDMYFKETFANADATYFSEDASVLAFAVHLDKCVDGKCQGVIVPIDYYQMKDYVKAHSFETDVLELFYKDGAVENVPYREYDGNYARYQHAHDGCVGSYRFESPADSDRFASALNSFKELRSGAKEASFEKFVGVLEKKSRKIDLKDQISAAGEKKTVQAQDRQYKQEQAR